MWRVLAADTTRYDANFRDGGPLLFLLDLGRILERDATRRRLADSAAPASPTTTAW